MPCNCSDIRTKTCHCKLIPKGFWGSSKDVFLVDHAGIGNHSFFLHLLERLYDKCAGYNLRYCPFRGVGRRDKYLSSTMKDLMILACFLLANFVVLLNITTILAVHLYYLLRDIALWIRARSATMSERKESFYFAPYLKRHDCGPPAQLKLS